MPKPAHPQGGATFDLTVAGRELRREDAYGREGHAARTLVRESDLRIVLVVLKAGGRIAEHRAGKTASIQTISGLVRVHLPEESVELPTQRLLVLEQGLRHDVEAIEESVFLLTLGWKDS